MRVAQLIAAETSAAVLVDQGAAYLFGMLDIAAKNNGLVHAVGGFQMLRDQVRHQLRALLDHQRRGPASGELAKGPVESIGGVGAGGDGGGRVSGSEAESAEHAGTKQ